MAADPDTRSPAALWADRSRELEPKEGHYSHYAAWCEWLDRAADVLNTDDYAAVWAGMGELEKVGLYSLFCHAAEGGPPHASPYPQPRTDAEALAIAVLRGDKTAAGALADKVLEERAAEYAAAEEGRAFVPRATLVQALRDAVEGDGYVCRRAACRVENAPCVHTQTGDRYCAACARRINRLNPEVPGLVRIPEAVLQSAEASDGQ